MTQPYKFSKAELNEIVNVAYEMADAARSAILPFFRSSVLSADNKLSQGFDPVTQADRAAEKAMRDVLARRRPQDAILGEEFAETLGSSSFRWVLDPIDGTRAFLCGAPTWGVLIALEHENCGPVFGLVDQPYTGERFVGYGNHAVLVTGQGNRELSTSQRQQLGDAILCSTFPEIGTREEKQAFDQVAQQCKLVRYGLDCYAYALLAEGHIDLVIEAGLNAYDVQAPIALIQSAGGIVTTWSGGPAHKGGQIVAAANSVLHQQAMSFLKPFSMD